MADIMVNGLQEPVMIRRDGYGIPHVQARDELDAWFGMGFAAAEDAGGRHRHRAGRHDVRGVRDAGCSHRGRRRQVRRARDSDRPDPARAGPSEGRVA